MSWWSRVANVFRRGRITREIDEELESHIEEALAAGRDPDAARRAFGSALRRREESRDIKLAGWLESLRSDAVFGWRQLLKNKPVSGAAILSLALAIGACTSAFRLIDALLFRPIPVAEPSQLYFLTYRYTDGTGKADMGDHFEYPLFRQLRRTVKGDAELLAISSANGGDLTYASDYEMEKAYRQYVSGWTFTSFGLRPAVGRLFTEQDDIKPGAHPYAVLSYDYWTRRFGRDPRVVGRTFRVGDQMFEIIGVAEKGFTGTDTGTVTDIFIPTMMNARAIDSSGWSWFRIWVRVRRGVTQEHVREKLQGTFTAFRRDTARSWGAGPVAQRFAKDAESPLVLEPAAAGVSGLQKDYRRSLLVLGAVVILVLLIACANVANLMTAQAASRAREMALRTSIGAGRSRLVRLVMTESALLALIATVLGGLFAWWSAPFVVSMIRPAADPARLVLPADWRVLGFAAAVAAAVTFLFGLTPALRASSVQPVHALRGGEDPYRRRRLMNTLVAAQVAFCFLVHFVAGLFIATFDRLSDQPTGFVADQVLTLETVAKGKQSAVYWEQVAQHLRGISGIESAALCGWALMSGNRWGSEVSVNHRPPEPDNPQFLSVSPGWLHTMRIPLIDGRDLRPEDTHPGSALVNEAFAKRYFAGENPVGRSFEQKINGKVVTVRIAGYVRDARYGDLREPIRPTVYVPFAWTDDKAALRSQDWGTFVVRTTGDPLRLAARLRQEVSRARSEFRVSNIRTQTELVEQHAIRERLLAILSLFFAIVALVLAAVGLYGVLNYSVLQRRREIGIRMALGAPAGDVARRVLAELVAMLLIGALAGLAAGVVSQRSLQALLYGVKPTDVSMLLIPVLTIFTAALLAALPPVLHAVRIEPAVTLRAE
jgi:putative ABC transport system permease protein